MPRLPAPRLPAPRLRLALLPLLLALAACGAGQTACGLVKVAELPTAPGSIRPILGVEINHRPAQLVMDTGAGGMALTQPAVDRLGLDYDERLRIEIRGVGNGSSSNFAAIVAGLKLGTAELPWQRAAVLPTLPSRQMANADGLLSLPVLERFDIDLDMQHHRVGLYQGRLCAGEALPVPGPLASLPLSYSHGQPHAFVPVELDGRPIQALLDTGAGTTLVRAAALGLPATAAAGEASGNMSGVGPNHSRVYAHRFRELRVGADRLPHPTLAVIGDMPDGIDMLLGMDYLAHRRVFISFSTDRVYIQAPRPPASPRD